jgi:P-type Ca2+ transporter type 2C
VKPGRRSGTRVPHLETTSRAGRVRLVGLSVCETCGTFSRPTPRRPAINMTAADTAPEPAPPMQAAESPHAVAVSAVLAHLDTDPDRGLTETEVASRRAQYGANELAEVSPPPLWRKILVQVTEPMLLILLAAAVLSAGIELWADALAILAIVVLNTILGVYQERRAEHALTALRKLSAPFAKVIRAGLPGAVPARELGPGDLIELEAGDHVPADVRLLTANGLRVQEAALTGESEPVDKGLDVVFKRDTTR